MTDSTTRDLIAEAKRLSDAATPGPWIPNTERYYMTAPVAGISPTSRDVPEGKCFMCLQGRALLKSVTYYGRENGAHVHYDEGGNNLWAITTPEGESVMSNNDADGGGFSTDDDLLFAAASRTLVPELADRLEKAEARIAAVLAEDNPGRVLADVRAALHVPEGYSIIEHATEMFRRNLRFCALYNTIQDIKPESFKDRWLFDLLKEQATRTDDEVRKILNGGQVK